MIAAFPVAAQARGPIASWTATGMQRVGPDEPAREDRTALLFAARGEFEPFQVIVKAPVGGLLNVTFRISDLKAPHVSSCQRSTTEGRPRTNSRYRCCG